MLREGLLCENRGAWIFHLIIMNAILGALGAVHGILIQAFLLCLC